MTLLTTADLRAAGLSRAAAHWRIRSGRWQGVHPGIYATHTGPLTTEEIWRAAVLYAGREASLSHATAAALHGLADAPPVPVHVTIPHERRIRPQPGLVVHRTTVDMPATRRGGLPVHQVERALLEWASLEPARANALLAAGVQQRLTTPGKLATCLNRLAASLPHRALLGQVLADVAGGTRSALEARCLALLRAAGMPEPARDHPVPVDGRALRVDLCYPDVRIAIEIDGRGFHLDAGAWRRDLRRQNQLVLSGWSVLRFTADDLRHRPAEVAERIRQAGKLRAVGTARSFPA